MGGTSASAVRRQWVYGHLGLRPRFGLSFAKLGPPRYSACFSCKKVTFRPLTLLMVRAHELDRSTDRPQCAQERFIKLEPHADNRPGR
jgi:hypothetical protein